MQLHFWLNFPLLPASAILSHLLLQNTDLNFRVFTNQNNMHIAAAFLAKFSALKPLPFAASKYRFFLFLALFVIFSPHGGE